MGLAKLQTAEDANAGRYLHIEHPDNRIPLYAFNTDPATGKEVEDKTRPVRMLLRGQDSDAYIQAEHKARNRNVENMKKRVDYSAAEDDRLGSETLAACVVSWENIPMGWVDGTDSEEPAPFTYDNALKVFENKGVKWVRIQADDFIGKRANFLKA